jgi:hypothetical protein
MSLNSLKRWEQPLEWFTPGKMKIVDVSGRDFMTPTPQQGAIDVTLLRPGTYLLLINGKAKQAIRFIKK